MRYTMVIYAPDGRGDPIEELFGNTTGEIAEEFDRWLRGSSVGETYDIEVVVEP